LFEKFSKYLKFRVFHFSSAAEINGWCHSFFMRCIVALSAQQY